MTPAEIEFALVAGKKHTERLSGCVCAVAFKSRCLAPHSQWCIENVAFQNA